MPEGIDVKADYVWIRKCFRFDRNPLLECSNNIIITTFDFEFLDSPFNFSSPYFDHYLSEQKNFFYRLQEKGFTVFICKTLDELKKLTLKKTLAYDELPGTYEQTLVNKLEAKLLSFEHLNYLLNEDDVDFSKLKPKFGFSKFRKLTESKAYKITNETIDIENPAYQLFHNYLSSGKAHSYFETRNALCGEGFSTRLSHLLNLGQISPKTILEMLDAYEKENGSNKSTYWIKFELLWREYFYWLYQYHQEDFFRVNGLDGGDKKLAPISIENYLNHMNKHKLIKAMNKELIETGFLSNRSRQIYVSYLVHETELDWRYGAWFFQYYLKDYDLYSNWGNWLYGSGNGTDSRGPRYFKLSKQLAQFDTQGNYLSIWSS